jgi:hypothetical protein
VETGVKAGLSVDTVQDIVLDIQSKVERVLAETVAATAEKHSVGFGDDFLREAGKKISTIN